MARVYELACDASSLRERYARLHSRVFSLRYALPVLGLRAREDYADLRQRLAELTSQLSDIESSVDALSAEDLTKRAPKEVQAALSSYVHALRETVARLETICSHLNKEQQGLPGYARYSETDLRRDKIDYDDAVQEYRRQGARLQRLFDKA